MYIKFCGWILLQKNVNAGIVHQAAGEFGLETLASAALTIAYL